MCLCFSKAGCMCLCYSSQMTYRLDIRITDDAKRFPSDVVVHYRVPYFNSLDVIYNNSAIDSGYLDLTAEYSESASVGQYGLDFSVSEKQIQVMLKLSKVSVRYGTAFILSARLCTVRPHRSSGNRGVFAIF